MGQNQIFMGGFISDPNHISSFIDFEMLSMHHSKVIYIIIRSSNISLPEFSIGFLMLL